MFSYRNKIFILILFIANQAFGQGQRYGNEWKLLELKGKVKYLSIHTIKPNLNGMLANIGDMQDSLLFNEQGKIVESYYFPIKFADTMQFTSSIYVYDINGRIEKKITNQKILSLLQHFEERYRYDSLGNQIEMGEYYSNADTASTWYQCEQQSDGKMLASLYSKKYGLLNKRIYAYDSLGRIISVGLIRKDGTREPDYHIQTNPCFIIQKNNKAETNMGSFYKYEYDSNGNWISMKQYEGNRLVKSITRTLRYY